MKLRNLLIVAVILLLSSSVPVLPAIVSPLLVFAALALVLVAICAWLLRRHRALIEKGPPI